MPNNPGKATPLAGRYDAVVVGAGIIGIATARQLQQRRPDWRILLVEKEAEVASHQSGHNSGVVHAGVYYPPGSLKARFCRAGHQLTLAFCEQHGIPYRRCGKLIVARREEELPALDTLHRRALENDLEVHGLSAGALRELEPRLSGVAAIKVPATAVVDYRLITATLARLFQEKGGELLLGETLHRLSEKGDGVYLETERHSLFCKQLICCAGLQADRLVKMIGLPCDFQIVPFRGEFHRLSGRCNDWLNHLVYPVPDPSLPFLGVHFTLGVDGGVTVGPNALLSGGREGYHRRDINFRDCLEMLFYPGLWKLLLRHWRAGLNELVNAYSRRHYTSLIQSYCPDILPDDLHPHFAGVRAQAVNRHGVLMQDFHFLRSRRSLHVGNAPSPAATAALPIANHIVDQLLLDGSD